MQFHAEADPNLAGPRLAYRGASPPPDDEIQLGDLWRALRRQWWVVLGAFLVGVGGSYI